MLFGFADSLLHIASLYTCDSSGFPVFIADSQLHTACVHDYAVVCRLSLACQTLKAEHRSSRYTHGP